MPKLHDLVGTMLAELTPVPPQEWSYTIRSTTLEGHFRTSDGIYQFEIKDGVYRAIPVAPDTVIQRAKNCKNSIPCGNGCISKSKNCRKTVSGAAKTAASAVATVAPLKSKSKSAKQNTGSQSAPPKGSLPGKTSPGRLPPQPSVPSVTTNDVELNAARALLVKKFGQKLVEDAEANAKKLTADADIYIQVGSSEVLGMILGDRFKTAHELGGRPGSDTKYLAARARTESKVLGLDPNTDPASRPIYGLLGSSDLNAREHLDPQGSYGQISVKLKSEVKNSTTLTGSDSFKSGFASRVDEPNAASLLSLTQKGHDRTDLSDADYRNALKQAAKAKDLGELATALSPHGGSYLEAQVQRKVGPDDIAELHFRPSGKHNAITPEIAQQAKDKGIKLFVNGKEIDPDSVLSPTNPRNKIDELDDILNTKDPSRLKQWSDDFVAQKSNTKLVNGERDADLKTLTRLADYDAKPQVVSSADIDADINGGSILLGRVVTDAPTKDANAIVDEFRSGDFYIGVGIYGDGTYVGVGATRNSTTTKQTEILTPDSLSIARQKVLSVTDTYSVPGKSAYKKMALDREARVITMDELEEVSKKYFKKVDELKAKEKEPIIKNGKRSTAQDEADYLKKNTVSFGNLQISTYEHSYGTGITVDTHTMLKSAYYYSYTFDSPKGLPRKGTISIAKYQRSDGTIYYQQQNGDSKNKIDWDVLNDHPTKEAAESALKERIFTAVARKVGKTPKPEAKDFVITGGLDSASKAALKAVDRQYNTITELLSNSSTMGIIAGADLIAGVGSKWDYSSNYGILLNRGRVKIQAEDINSKRKF